MFYAYAQDWSNGAVTLHKTLGDRNSFCEAESQLAEAGRGIVPVGDPRCCGVDANMIETIEGNGIRIA